MPLDSSPAAGNAATIQATLQPMFDDLRRFIDRRIAEVSAEVHGAVQLVDFSETNLTGQLNRLHEQIAGLIALPGTATRNSGIELEAVIQATEAAANQILEAAEAISDWVHSGARDSEGAIAELAARVESIFEACSFQDVTGQRIRRAIQHLQHVDSVLAGLANPGGTVAQVSPPKGTVESIGPDLGQDVIDRLLA